MQYGINMVTLGDYADPRQVVRVAQAAEAAGWDGLFVWDHLAFAWGVPSGDPWVILAAVAQATTHLKIGTAITPLPRRRPHVIANTVATLDVLSEGRVIFGAGLGGVPQEYSAFGESDDQREQATRLDESLTLLDRLWAGEAVTHRGLYTLENVTLTPLPVQRPRVPIWIGGMSKPALRRAAHWDGWVFAGDNENGDMVMSPEQLAQRRSYIQQHRTATSPFDIAMSGCSMPGDGPNVRIFAETGLTWWLESIHGFRGSIDAMLTRVEAGPPSL
jgi:alkanesulfonate monooxygenase SsuD/methylene tetrahydromethanopterin reductase-like flavin-dependent oxidoreductase (luciferase family)